MDADVLQSTSLRVALKAYLSSDHLSAATSKTIAVVISKNGGSFANPSAGATNATEIANGWYYVDLSTTDTGTLGPLIVRGTAASTDDVELVIRVVKATNRGMTGIPDVASGSAGAVITSGTGTAQLNVSGGKAPATLAVADVSGNLPVDLQTIKTQAVTCSAGVTVGAFLGNATAAITVDASGRLQVQAGTSTGQLNLSSGRIGINWADVANPTTTVNLSGTMISAGQAVASVSGSVTVGTNTDKAGYSLAAAGLDSVVIETGLNARQAVAIIASAAAGLGGTTSGLYKGAGVATTRITFSAAGGERSSVTLSPPA